MHASSMENMQKYYEKYICGEYLVNKAHLKVLDIGGANVNGSYADIFSSDKFQYLAADIEAGDGVDVVLTDPYKFPFEDESVDIVISGQAFEHVEFFWLLFEEMARVIKKNGFIILIAPSAGPIHRYPVDCYRFYPDAYYALAKYVNIKVVEVFHDNRGPWKDLVGVFNKNKGLNVISENTNRKIKNYEINRYMLSTMPVSLMVGRQSEEVEKIQGEINYLNFFKSLHNQLKPVNYFEIGVRKGNSLSLATCQKIAIDPEADINLNDYENLKFFKMTSDHFFCNHSNVIDTNGIDLAFIDGMHLFEFVLRDFINIENHAHSNTVVIIDDIFPNNEIQSSRIRKSQVWTGDVWKIIPCLMHYRKDLRMTMLNTSPTGLLLISNLKPKNQILTNNYNPIIRKYKEINISQYSDLVIKRNKAISPINFNISDLK